MQLERSLRAESNSRALHCSRAPPLGLHHSGSVCHGAEKSELKMTEAMLMTAESAAAHATEQFVKRISIDRLDAYHHRGSHIFDRISIHDRLGAFDHIDALKERFGAKDLQHDALGAANLPLLAANFLRDRRDALHSSQSLMRDTSWWSFRMKLLRLWRRCRKTYDRLRLKHVVPIVLLILYSFLGGILFYTCEHNAEKTIILKERQELIGKLRALDDVRRQVLERCWEVHWESKFNKQWTKVKIMPEMRKAFLWYEDNFRKLKIRDLREPQWDKFWNALFYAGTVYTTIGYGNIAPVSDAGRILTIVYSIFGIPIMFFVLHKLGRMFCVLILKLWDFLTKSWSLVCKVLCRKGKLKHAAGDEAAGDDEQQYDDSRKEERHLYDVPVSLALAITLGWMLMCSGLFLAWERDWSYFTSVYFFFVSLTTIGLGDVVPKHIDRMIMNFGLVIVGLSLVTMCINIVQVKLEHLFHETVLMILKKYQEAQVREDNEMGDDDYHASVGILQLWQNHKRAKWLKNFLGQRQKDLLVEEWKARAKMRPQGTQTAYRGRHVSIQVLLQPVPVVCMEASGAQTTPTIYEPVITDNKQTMTSSPLTKEQSTFYQRFKTRNPRSPRRPPKAPPAASTSGAASAECEEVSIENIENEFREAEMASAASTLPSVVQPAVHHFSVIRVATVHSKPVPHRRSSAAAVDLDSLTSSTPVLQITPVAIFEIPPRAAAPSAVVVMETPAVNSAVPNTAAAVASTSASTQTDETDLPLRAAAEIEIDWDAIGALRPRSRFRREGGRLSIMSQPVYREQGVTTDPDFMAERKLSPTYSLPVVMPELPFSSNVGVLPREIWPANRRFGLDQFSELVREIDLLLTDCRQIVSDRKAQPTKPKSIKELVEHLRLCRLEAKRRPQSYDGRFRGQSPSEEKCTNDAKLRHQQM